MKIVFMGTPDFAIPSLKKLVESNHSIAAVVSAPDKERGRGREVSFTPVKDFALKNNLEILSPVSLKDQNFVERLKEIDPDLFVVVAFRILPKEIYSIPKKGSFNLHGSLLPKYRGAAPIQWALINGEKETGVTTFFLEDKIDTGNIILQERILIDDEDNFGSLHDKMMELGATIVLKTVDQISTGKYRVSKQDGSLASPAPKITKEICQIDWNKSAYEIHNLVRGLSPYPSAFFIHEGKSYKVFKTKVIENYLDSHSQPTERIVQTKNEIYFATRNGILQILELQPEGRKRMAAEDFLRGHKFFNDKV